MPERAPYGSWHSPITADLIASESRGLGQIALDGDDACWLEARPWEGGRQVVVRRGADGRTRDLLPAPYSARNRVHEYGGGAYAVDAGTLYFCHDTDQRLYRLDPGGGPRPLVPEGPVRYADAAVDRGRGRLICVREDHRRGGEPENTLVAVDCAGAGARVLARGADFYAAPRLDPEGRRLAWLTWSHPDMPWDGSELWVADIAGDGALGAPRRIAGGREESVLQPQWSPQSDLYFVSDRSGWWNPYRWRDGRVQAVAQLEAEFGIPPWQFGHSSYAFLDRRRIVYSYRAQDRWRLALLDTGSLRFQPHDLPYSDIAQVRAGNGRVVMLAGSPAEPWSVVQWRPDGDRLEVLARSDTTALDARCLSRPRPVEFPTEDGLTAHGFFYAPRNDDYVAPADERPPLIVVSHGGPTAATSGVLNLRVQYWTSRGIAVLDVDYGGSSGYGRAYRQRLHGQWGVVDVEDCVNGARHAAAQGWADGARLIIRGASAGGYTALCALVFHDLFRAGASYYGIGDLEALARDTHKFESRYLDRLIGPYPARRDLYRERSPIHHLDRLACPVIFFQGLEDKVVPPNQAQAMVDALRARGLPVAYVPFPGEQHGFRKAEHIKRALEAELYFYSRVLGLPLAEPIEPVTIHNLPAPASH